MNYEEKIIVNEDGKAVVKRTDIWIVKILPLLGEGKTMTCTINYRPNKAIGF